ncbi:MAG TPA: hypothetical protein VN458_07215 [Solirubrobacterales bacterium]|nr:hypothetical protein [Solirubrobacterales bacterium]
MIYESLEDKGLVDFSAATEIITSFLDGPTILPSDSAAAQAVADLMHLNAAEVALGFQVLRSESIRSPLPVHEEAAHLAIWATNSGPFLWTRSAPNPSALGCDASG